MAKSPNQKLKMLVLKEFFERYTDKNHPKSMEEIISFLAGYDIEAERKSIYDDIDALNEFYFRTTKLHVTHCKKGRQYLYYLEKRYFNDSELTTIVNAVASAKFLTERKVEELMKKLARFETVYQEKNIAAKITVKGRVRSTEEGTLENINTINRAIRGDRQISFSYMQWNEEKKLVLRKDGEKTGISPWQLVWDNEYYYLVAYDPAKKDSRHYRVDKMRKVTVLPEKREGAELLSGKKDFMYSNSFFGMYHGKLENITFLCEKDMLNVLLDRFGTGITVRKSYREPGKFEVRAEVCVSKNFLGWVTGLGNGIRILSPQSAVDRMASLSASVLRQSRRGEENGSHPIRNLVFDVGNVLVDFRYMAYMEELGFSLEERAFFAENIVLSPDWLKMDSGERTEEENIALWKERYPEKTELFDRFFENPAELVRPYPDTAGLLADYKKMGYRIFLLTNYPPGMFRLHSERSFDFMDSVDGFVCSAFEKEVKPEPEIYKTLLERYGLVPEECVFLDDREENVLGAETVGIHGISAKNRREGLWELESFLSANGRFHRS